MVGGASVITFPVLLAVGLPPVVATASNLVAVSAGNFLAALTDRDQLPPFNRAFVGLVLASVLGAVLGAVLLLATPDAHVRGADPAAARLCDRAVRLRRPHHAVAARARASARGREWKMSVTSIPLLLPISVYGGYFGAGAGMLLLGVLIDRDRGRLSLAPTWPRIWCRASTPSPPSVWFIANGAVSWPQTLVMMAGCLIGGFCGAHLARRVPQRVHAGGGRRGRRAADRGVRLAVLVLGSASPAPPAASVIALLGSAIGSQTVKWFMPGTAS